MMDYDTLFKSDEFIKLKKEIQKSEGNNIFKILNLQNYEIRHSSYLAWLLKQQNYCLLIKLFEKIGKTGIKIPENTEVHTEYHVPKKNKDEKNGRIDIFIKADNFVCVIENKYGSKEHDEQCKTYKEFVEKTFAEIKKDKRIFIYLDIFKPDEELFKTGQSLEGYKSVTYKDILEILKNLKLEDDFDNKILMQYRIVIKDNYIFDEDEENLCEKILSNENNIEILLKKLEFDEKNAENCNTVYKIQTYMWNFAHKKANKLIESIYEELKSNFNLKLIKSNGKYIANNYGVYRFIPKDCNVDKLNFGKDYNPIIHMAISNNLEVYSSKNGGINISIEVAKCSEENKINERNKLITGKKKTNTWTCVRRESLITNKDMFNKIFSEELNISKIIESNKDKIEEIINQYKKIVNAYNSDDE